MDLRGAGSWGSLDAWRNAVSTVGERTVLLRVFDSLRLDLARQYSLGRSALARLCGGIGLTGLGFATELACC